MLWTLTSVAKTIPSNYVVKPIDFNCNPVPGSTVTDYHWNLSKQYEEEVERQANIEYNEVAKAVRKYETGEAFLPMMSFSAQDKALTLVFDKEIGPPTDEETEDKFGAVAPTTVSDLEAAMLFPDVDMGSDE